MKRILFVMGLALLVAAMPTMAQQRKPANRQVVKKTATTKKPVAKPSPVSIPMEGEAVIDGKYAYLGISLNETPANMRAKLKTKGMTIKKDYNGEMTEVHGVVDGVKVRLDVQNVSSGGCLVRQYDEKGYLLPKAKQRFNALLDKVVSLYGKGEYQRNEDNWKHYMIKTDSGEVSIELLTRMRWTAKATIIWWC